MRSFAAMHADHLAYNYLTDKSGERYIGERYIGEGQFSQSGTYRVSHGQHSRPVYQIVSRKSGRCNKTIIATLETLSR